MKNLLDNAITFCCWLIMPPDTWLMYNIQTLKLCSCPPNMKAKLQPLDQGIIRVVKFFYCKAITEKVLAHIDRDKPDDLQNVMNLLDFVMACKNIVAAWNNVSEALIVKCFQKADFIVSVPNCPEPEPAPDHNLWDNIQ